MLGVKRIGNNQIDLWQGEASEFVCDLLLSGSISFFIELYEKKDAQVTTHRHIALALSDSLELNKINKLFSSMESFLAQDPKSQKRISLLVNSSSDYKLLQTALLSFP